MFQKTRTQHIQDVEFRVSVRRATERGTNKAATYYGLPAKAG